MGRGSGLAAAVPGRGHAVVPLVRINAEQVEAPRP